MEETLEAKEEWIPAEDFKTGLTADDWKEILEDDDFIKNHPAGSIALWLYYDNRNDTPLSYTGLAEKYGIYDGYYKGGMGQFDTGLACSTKFEISLKFKEKIRQYTDEKGNKGYWYLSFTGRKATKEEPGSFIFKLRKEVCDGFDKLSEERRQMFEEMYQHKKKEYKMNPKPTIWVIAAGNNGNLWNDFVTNKRISIGWDKGDLTNTEPSTKNLSYFKKAKIGDFVFSRKGAQNFIGFGRIDGEYKYEESKEDHRNTRSVTWLEIWTEQPKKTNASYNEKQAFIEIKDENKETDEIKDVIRRYMNAENIFELNSKEQECLEKLKKSHQIILTGAPGTGKSYAAHEIANVLTGNKAENIEFVQFHPSMDYTDFVEGLRPIKDNNGQIGFERQDGIFKAFCKRALENQENFVFIIDEINRGDISKIFGELFFAIDPSYRGEKGKITTQYQNLVESDDLYADGFYIPENVYIIGTMNDIDRGVESMDFAIRRRFTWIEVNPDDTQSMLDSQDSGIPEYAADAKERMGALNKVISTNPSLGKAYQIGAAYFLRLNELNGDFDALWAYHLEPLLLEYLRGDPRAEEFLDEMKKAYGVETE